MNILIDDVGKHIATFKDAYTLRSGQTLDFIQLAYETHGHLNADKSNVILAMHSLSMDCHLKAHALNSKPGWWEHLVGPGLAIDTNKYFVICINHLGSCFGSTGPTSINPKTQQPYGPNFPQLSLEDIAISQKKLLDFLDIKTLHAVVGGSLGGMLVLAFAALFPHMAKKLVAISMCHKAYPIQIAHRMCQREAIFLDSDWRNGYYHHNPTAGLKVARMISHLFYRGFDEINQRFTQNTNLPKGDVKSYYHYNAEKFSQLFDTNTYLLYLDMMDQFDLEATFGSTLFDDLSADVMVIASSSDMFYPPFQQEAVVDLLNQKNKNVTYLFHESIYGHDAFLVEAKKLAHPIHDFIKDS